MDANQLKKGMICKLTVGWWRARITMPKEFYAENTPTQILEASQILVLENCKFKTRCNSCRRQAVQIFQTYGIKTSAFHAYWIEHKYIRIVNIKLKRIQKEFFLARDFFLKNYKESKKQYRNKYPQFYRRTMYPSKQKLKTKFFFHWQFIDYRISPASKKIIPKYIYNEEIKKIEKFTDTIDILLINKFMNENFIRLLKISSCLKLGWRHKKKVKQFNSHFNFWKKTRYAYIGNKKMRLIIKELTSVLHELKFLKKINKTNRTIIEKQKLLISKKIKSITAKIKGIPGVKITAAQQKKIKKHKQGLKNV